MVYSGYMAQRFYSSDITGTVIFSEKSENSKANALSPSTELEKINKNSEFELSEPDFKPEILNLKSMFILFKADRLVLFRYNR